jgi:hypothetical protein
MVSATVSALCIASQAMRICEGNWRRRPDLNRGWRFCRPLARPVGSYRPEGTFVDRLARKSPVPAPLSTRARRANRRRPERAPHRREDIVKPSAPHRKRGRCLFTDRDLWHAYTNLCHHAKPRQIVVSADHERSDASCHQPSSTKRWRPRAPPWRPGFPAWLVACFLVALRVRRGSGL